MSSADADRMLVKWIRCTVAPDRMDDFATAQSGWNVIADQPGFVGQLGGWTEAGTAHILGLWATAEHHDRFMRERHDAVADTIGQRSTYTALTVATGPVAMTMAGEAASLTAAFDGARLLRVADCAVRSERVEHFLDVQRQVWAPAMASATGMLGGVFAQLGERRSLVATLWSPAAAHQQYVARQLPALRARARPEQDLEQTTGLVLNLEPRWRVVGT